MASQQVLSQGAIPRMYGMCMISCVLIDMYYLYDILSYGKGCARYFYCGVLLCRKLLINGGKTLLREASPKCQTTYFC